MAISNNSTGLRTGVCLSSTRPTAPYAGQTIFETDTNKMLVWNGSIWVMPNKPSQNPDGLELVTSTTVATAATCKIDNCFTSTYDNYLVVFTGHGLSANDYFYYRLVDGTTPDIGNNYNTDRMEQYSTTVAGLELLNTNAAYVGQAYGTTTGYFHGQVTLFEPQVARRTASYGTFMSKGTGSLVTTTTSCLMGVTTQYEGIQFVTNTGSTFNGTFTVYGYRK